MGTGFCSRYLKKLKLCCVRIKCSSDLNADRFVIVVEEFKSRNELLSLANKLLAVFRQPLDGGSKE